MDGAIEYFGQPLANFRVGQFGLVFFNLGIIMSEIGSRNVYLWHSRDRKIFLRFKIIPFQGSLNKLRAGIKV